MNDDDHIERMFGTSGSPSNQRATKYTCARHGEYEPNRRNWHDRDVCPQCIADGEAIKAPWKAAWAEYSRWQHAQIPEHFRNRRLGNYRPHTENARQALAASRELVSKRIRALALIGDVGTGKTHLSVGILAAAIREGSSGLWVHVPTLLREWRATFSKGSEQSEEQILQRLQHAQVLVLDECGATSRTEWELNAISMLIDERYRNGGAIVITGNLPHLAAGIGERGADRIDEMGVTLALTGASYRTRAVDDPGLKVDDDFIKPPTRIRWTVCEAGIDRVEAREW